VKTLFAQLNLAHPGLEAVSAAVARDDLETAGGHLLTYYSGQRQARCLDFWDLSGPEDYTPMPWGAATTHDQLWKNTPDQVLAGQLYASGHTFDFSRDADIDWCSDIRLWADGGKYPHAQARVMLRRLYWLRALDLCYLRGDPAEQTRAAAQFSRLMTSWLDQWVEEEFAVNHGIALADTISHSGLVRSWFVFLPAPQVPAELKLRLLQHIAEGAADLLARAAWHPWIWGLSEAGGLGLTGALLPELKGAPAWRARCFEFANRFFQTELRPDGTLKRMHFCPHYTGATAIWPLAFYPLLAKLGYTDMLEPGARLGVERMVDWIATVQKPDNTIPQITASDIQGFSRWLASGAAPFHRPDWLYVATAGREGRPPAHTSRVLPEGGAFCLRDGFTTDAMVGCLHNGDYHNLERTSLALDLYAFGRTLVTAPGRYGYYTPEFLPYFAAAGYNSLMVDGSPQQIWGEHSLRQGAGLTDAGWRRGAAIRPVSTSRPTCAGSAGCSLPRVNTGSSSTASTDPARTTFRCAGCSRRPRQSLKTTASRSTPPTSTPTSASRPCCRPARNCRSGRATMTRGAAGTRRRTAAKCRRPNWNTLGAARSPRSLRCSSCRTATVSRKFPWRRRRLLRVATS